MSRRLLNRASRPTADHSPSSPSSSSTITVTALPDYQPLACPLDANARKALGDLSNGRGTASYETQLKDSVRLLGLSVGDLHERLHSQRSRLSDLAARRQGKRDTSKKTQEEERLDAHVPQLEQDVDELTRASERALRRVIDRRAELEDEAVVLADLFTAHAAQPQGDSGGVLDTFQRLRAAKGAEYARMSAYERYALNNDYAGFKKLWHDAAVGEDGPPLQDASRWFTQDGEPDMSTAAARRHGSTDDDQGDGDDEIAIARETISLKCPLTLLEMTEPYANRKCPHVFEKYAILDYLGSATQCPQTGCSQVFSHSDLEQEWYLDVAMLRRIQRSKQQESRHLDDEEDEEEEEDEEHSMVVDQERPVRAKRVKQEH